MPIKRTRAEQTHALACTRTDAERRAVIQDELHRRIVIVDDESLADYERLPTQCEVGPHPIVGPHAVKPAPQVESTAVDADAPREFDLAKYIRETDALRAAGCYAFTK